MRPKRQSWGGVWLPDAHLIEFEMQPAEDFTLLPLTNTNWPSQDALILFRASKTGTWLLCGKHLEHF
jgi:hypothetical protein